MALFRAYQLFLLVAIVAYTAVTVARHGLNLFPDFTGAIAAMGWPGQFNVDFTGFLSLSAIWVAWRHRFSAAGLALGVLAFFGGSLFLSIYLLAHAARARGDARVLLLGESRA